MIKVITATSEPEVEATQAFSAFVCDVEPRLRRALVGVVGADRAPDAVAEALTWAWENWARVRAMQNPAGYLYRVARSHGRVRPPKKPTFIAETARSLPDVEPALPSALQALPERQRTVVWLIYACEWSYAEVAEALDISASAVGTHARRGLRSLRSQLGEVHD